MSNMELPHVYLRSFFLCGWPSGLLFGIVANWFGVYGRRQSWGAINILVLDQCFRRWHMCCFIMMHKKVFHVGNHDCVNLSLDSCIPHKFWFVCIICATLFSFDDGHVVCIKLVVHDNGRGCWIFWEVRSRLQSSQRKISFLWIVWSTPWSL
jgi:hypothetical protein